MRDPSAAEQLAAKRDEITKLAVVGDVAGLRAAANSLPPTLDFAYDRQRARAMALALEGKSDQAVAELKSGSAAQLQTPSTVAADLAEIRLLAGDPKAAVEALSLGLEEPERARHRALAGALAAAGAAAGAAAATAAAKLRLERPVDDRLRIAAGGAALGSAVIALLLLPRTLDDENGGRTATQLARPDRPRPSVVRVASPPAPTPGESRSRARDVSSEEASEGSSQATSAVGAGSSFGDVGQGSPAPGASAPDRPTRPPRAEPPSPTPQPGPAPTQPPASSPPSEPSSSPPATTRSSSQAAAGNTSSPTPPTSEKPKKAKKAKKEKPQPTQPAQTHSSNAGGVSDEVPLGPPSNAAEQKGGPPGQEKKDEEKEKGPKK